MNKKSTPFLHELTEFKDLIGITAREEKIDPALVEKDYWIMHVLWGLQNLEFNFELKGGTSLSKGFCCIHRFSEDIDIRIKPDEKKTGFKIYDGKNHDDQKHRDSRKKYFDWLKAELNKKIPGITEITRDETFDDIPKYRSGGIRLFYQSLFGVPKGLKDGILLEVGFDRTAPNQPCDISSWTYEKASKSQGVTFVDNRALAIACYEPKFTFVEKLQAVVKKYRQYKEGKEGASLPANFIRHYYDLFQLIDRPEVQKFIGTSEYNNFKDDHFRGDDAKVSNSDAFTLSDSKDRTLFEKEYDRSESLYFRGRPSLSEILERIGKDLERL